MGEIRFTWDDGKAGENQRRHKVSFDEAKTVFYDENARLRYDPDHSEDEDRFVLLGDRSKITLCFDTRFASKITQIVRRCF